MNPEDLDKEVTESAKEYDAVHEHWNKVALDLDRAYWRLVRAQMERSLWTSDEQQEKTTEGVINPSKEDSNE